MNKQVFLKEFRAILPDTLSETSIDLENPESTTLFWIGKIISKMSNDAQYWYDTTTVEINDTLIDIVSKKYSIEW